MEKEKIDKILDEAFIYYYQGNYELAFKRHLEAAELGDSFAQFMVAEAIYMKKGTTYDLNKMEYWYTKSAEQDYSEAQSKLANLYLQKILKDIDNIKALYWLLRAAENNNSYSAYQLGCYYFDGIDRTKDYTKAIYWFKKSLELGYNASGYELGICYQKGYGVRKDNRVAYRYFKMAAEANKTQSMFNLGECYYKGCGTKQNFSKALKWFEIYINKPSFDLDDLPACLYYLGCIYYYGFGVEPNYNKGREYLFDAARHGYEEAIHILSFIEPDNEIDVSNLVGSNVEFVINAKQLKLTVTAVVEYLKNYYAILKPTETLNNPNSNVYVAKIINIKNRNTVYEFIFDEETINAVLDIYSDYLE